MENCDQMLEVLLAKKQNTDKKLLILFLKPYDRPLNEFTPPTKGEYEDLGYRNRISTTTTHNPGKMY